MNSFLLVCDVFLFVCWKTPRPGKKRFEIIWPLTFWLVQRRWLTNQNVNIYICIQCFVHPMLSFCFWYLGHLVAWFSIRFFPSCLAKCKQRLRNIFIFLSPKVTKNQKWRMGWRKHNFTVFFFQKLNEFSKESDSKKHK